MPAKRNKIVTPAYGTDAVTYTYYTSPGDQPQQVAGTYTIAYADMPLHPILAAKGVTALTSERCNASRNGAHPDVPDILKTIITTARNGGILLQPRTGTRARATGEPTPLQLALAELRHLPIERVVNEFKTALRPVSKTDKTPYRDVKGRTHKYFTKPMIAEIEQIPEVAAVIARIMSERGHQATPDTGLDLTTLPL